MKSSILKKMQRLQKYKKIEIKMKIKNFYKFLVNSFTLF